MGHLVLLFNWETVLRTHLTSTRCGFKLLPTNWQWFLTFFSVTTLFSSGLNHHLSQTSLCVKQSEVPHHPFDSRCFHWRIPPLWQVKGGDSQRWMTDRRRRVTKRLVSIWASVQCMVLCTFSSLSMLGLCLGLDSVSEICSLCWRVVACCHIVTSPKDSEEFNSVCSSCGMYQSSLNMMKHTWEHGDRETPGR